MGPRGGAGGCGELKSVLGGFWGRGVLGRKGGGGSWGEGYRATWQWGAPEAGGRG